MSGAVDSFALADHTTMRVGGEPARFVTATTTDEVVDAVRVVDEADEPLGIFSGGSNLVVADEGVDATVLKVATTGITVESDDACGGVFVRVAAGESWDAFVAHAVASGWAGIETLAGIPGCVGSTPVQNVGAYGQEVSQTIARVRTWDRAKGQVRTFTAAECDFAYRHSRFKVSVMPGRTTGEDPSHGLGGFSPRYVVLDVTFQFEHADLSRPIAYADLARGLDVELGARVPLADAREAVLEQRRRRGMVLETGDHDTWSCGSFFTNPILTATEFEQLTARVEALLGEGAVPPAYPAEGAGVKTSAAWLIDKSGFGKGYGMPGPAALSTKHVLALTNRGGATATQIVALAREIRDGVQDRLGVRLVNEPVLVGLTL
ncbi:MAG: UDP-N-acetylmuramate dehydrogenase [Mobilicoccus sp.]|nr:UDP-N-acetylmuramate dehydrogenase [Mobilicoccus sp.]